MFVVVLLVRVRYQKCTKFALLRHWLNCGASPGGSDGEESACNVGDPGLIPGLERCAGEGKGYPLQFSCLENPMGREAWQATIHGVAKSWTRLSN